MPRDRDSLRNVLAVGIGVCAVCSVLVSAAVVALRPRQDANRALEVKRNILAAAGLLPADGAADIDALFGRVRPRVVELATGQYRDDVDARAFDMRAAAEDPATSRALPSGQDPAGLRRLPLRATVYELDEGGRLGGLILPIWGMGLWSTLRGFVALGPDLRTITGLGFYEHGETPGLGGEVDNPRWKALWPGKQAFDEQGQLTIRVIKGSVDPGDPAARFKVDGLAGSTITTRGVDNLVRFWLGEGGYGPLLRSLDNGAGGRAPAPQGGGHG